MSDFEKDAESRINVARKYMPVPVDRIIARAILADIGDRRAWKRCVEETDKAVIEEEVLPAWEAIVRQALKQARSEGD